MPSSTPTRAPGPDAAIQTGLMGNPDAHRTASIYGHRTVASMPPIILSGLQSSEATGTIRPMISSFEHILEGGNVAETVVRVGSTVRKPATVSTAAVEALLDHFAEVGFSGTPRSLGRDELGRHVLEYVPGETTYTLAPLTAGELRRLGAFIHECPDVHPNPWPLSNN